MNLKSTIATVATLSTFFSYIPVAEAQTVYRTRQIVNLQVVQGQPQWGQRAAQRLAGAVWQFNPDGTFIFAPPDSRDDLYPLRGNFQNRGNIITFQGGSRAGNSVSSNAAQVTGQIDYSTGQPVMTLEWANGTVMGAVVNDIRFGASNLSHYRSVLILQ